MRTLTYRQRTALVLGAGLLFFVIVCAGYLQPTFALWRSNVAQAQALVELQRAPEQLQQLTAQARADAWLMRGYRIDTTRQEGYLLNQLSQTARQYGVTLAALSRGATLNHAGYQVQTRIAKLRGPFRGLVQAVHSLEYERPVGRLASVRFVVEEDRKQRRDFLFAYLYLQSISREVHEKPLP
ncbi:hypothetical protein GCM10028824_43870 [Hymenobacter segetis]|uniref:Uncharacterized protein n=1 Tax=Hymenobacter segetis TaxID=2025509 RepID=A0ABU9LWQ0_9BACT